MTLENLLTLLAEIEAEDPIDYTGLPFDAQDLRQLACLNVLEMFREKMDGMDRDSRDLVMGATVVRLVLENMVLQARIALLMQDVE